jgi:hypothetical protein
MRDVRVPQIGDGSSAAGAERRLRDSTRSLVCLLWILVGPLVGFLLAETVFDLGETGDWTLWKAAALGVLLMVPFGVGTYFGLRAVVHHDRAGWIGAIGNAALAALAVGMPVAESLSG